MDRFDPRWDDDRDHTQSADRDWGGRSGRSADDSRHGDERSPFARDLDLPGGNERERVRARDRDYDLGGADTEALATVGAFRVVQVENLRDVLGASRGGASAHQRVDRLRESGLLERIPLDGRERAVVVLTERAASCSRRIASGVAGGVSRSGQSRHVRPARNRAGPQALGVDVSAVRPDLQTAARGRQGLVDLQSAGLPAEAPRGTLWGRGACGHQDRGHRRLHRRPEAAARRPPCSRTASEPASVNRPVELLRHMLNWAVGREYLPERRFDAAPRS